MGMLLALAVMGTTIFGTNALAGNIEDREYAYQCNGDTWYQTPSRDKLDYTSSYVFHQGDVPIKVSVYNGSNNYTYGASYAYCPVGQATYIPNLIKESGLNSCFLLMRVAYPPQTALIHGVWSPDSV